MRFYIRTVLQQDFLTKFSYKNLAQIPKLKKITLNFTLSQSSLKAILPLLSALTLLSNQKAFLFPLKNSKFQLKLRQGIPVGCKVDLRGDLMYLFLYKFIFFFCSYLKEFHGFVITGNNLFCRIDNLFLFKEIEKEYEQFSDLPSLNMSLIFQTSSDLELFNYLSGLHLPVKKL
jgi:large subunit ribosomal protein L5